MSSQLKVILDFNNKEDFSNEFPFTIKDNLKEICDYYKLDLLKIELFSDDILDWRGFFFHKKVEGKVFI